ncbi:MAG TPA: PAS domain S-box protein [Gallionella sp.]|nr:PAS domain S-box protein [Gallionella sp.]
MKIRSRLQLIILTTFAVAVTVTVVMVAVNREMARERAQIENVQATLEALFRLRGRTFEYLTQPEARVVDQWHAEQEEIGSRLRALAGATPEEQSIAESSRRDLERSNAIFDQLTALGPEAERAGGREILSGQLQLKIQSVASGMLRLEETMRQRLAVAQQRATLIITTLMAVLILIIAAGLLLLGRSILRPLSALRKGVEIIGAGNLEYRFGLTLRDEIGELAGAFELMTKSLQRTKADLVQAGAYTRSLIEASLDPLVTISAEGKITDVNRATEEATGRARNELIGTDFSNYFTERDKARLGYQEVFAKGTVKDYPLSIRHRDGRVTDVLYNASTYRNDAGEVLGVFAAARDVTARKRAEEELSSASLYARSLLEASLDPLVTISAEGKITDVNEATVEATGVPRKLLVGSDFSNYFTEPDKARAGYQEVFAKGFVMDYPLALRHVSGRVMEVVYNASVYRNTKGEVAGAFAAARNITERKRTEQELRATSLYARSLIEASLDPLVTISADGKVTDVNEATVEVTGVPRKLLIGSDFSSYFTEPDKARSGYQEVFAKGFVTDYPLAIRHASGKVTDVLYNASVYRNERGEVTGVFAAARDITERKRAEEELRRYHEHLEELVRERTSELEAANKDLEGFAYSVSHDLRTPLRAIDGFSRILLEDYPDKLDDEGKRLLNVVRDNTSRMSHLIDDILQFSRTGRAEMTMAEIDMEALAHTVFEELQPVVDSPNLQLEIGHLPPALGDRAMLRQVFANLLSNAIKFSRAKETPRIEVGSATAENETVYFVKDNGVGFDMQYVGKLFGVFQRLHGINEFEGTGIGLAIVKRIITRHGGRVWAEGKLDEGATIYFALPLRQT